jgi:hypothetical protein
MRTIQISLLFLTVVLQADIVQAQGLPVVDSSRVELGYLHRHIKRYVYIENSNRNLDGPRSWAFNSLLLRVRITERVAAVVTGMYWPPSLDESTGRRYQTTAVGGGVTVYPLRSERLRLGVTFRYHWLRWTDKSPQAYHKTVYGLLGAAHLEYVITLRGQSGIVWIGPGFVLDRNREEPEYFPQHTFSSVDNLGLIAGGHVLLFGHIRPYAQVTYASFLQPELGFSIVL